MGRRGSKYCEKCGCYLPEGETVCVSCRYDPTAPTLSKCIDWVYPTSMISNSKNYANNHCQSNTLLIQKVRLVMIHEVYGRVHPANK